MINLSILKTRLRSLAREALADVVALETERDALRARAEKAEGEADRFKVLAQRHAGERDAWRQRALKAEAEVAIVVQRAAKPAALKVAPAPTPSPSPSPSPTPAPTPAPARPRPVDDPRIPTAVRRDEQRGREFRAVRAVPCPECQAASGEGCAARPAKRGPFHPERWEAGKAKLARADAALAVACEECGAKPGVWCEVDGKRGLHKTRENDAAKE